MHAPHTHTHTHTPKPHSSMNIMMIYELGQCMLRKTGFQSSYFLIVVTPVVV